MNPRAKRPKRIRFWIAIAALIVAVILGGLEASRQVQLRMGMTLHEAAANGDADEVRRLLRLRANVHATDEAGDTALHLAAKNLQVDAVRMLLEENAEVDAKDGDGKTSLQRAMKRAGPMSGPILEVARLLLERGAEPNLEGANGRPLVTVAAFSSHSELAELFLLHGARFDEQGALDWGHPMNFASIAEHDPLFATRKHVDGKTLLEIYMEKNSEDSVRVLLPFVDPNLENEKGEPLLIQFVREGKEEWARILVNFGADLSARGDEGLTPLHFAVRDGRSELVTMFVQRVPDLDARDAAGFTPLH